MGALACSCNKIDLEDQTTNDNTQEVSLTEMSFTATLNAKDTATKSVDSNGVTAWEANEQIAVYYEQDGGDYGTATATVDAVNDGKATISASLTDPKNGGEVKFVYPASIVNATGDDIDADKLSTQHGTIADISANFDAATGSGTLVTDGATCGTSTTVTLTNQVLIGKFTPKFGGSAIDGITTLTVTNGTRTYTVTPASGTFGTGGIYVAMLPVDDQEVIITAATATDKYGYGGKKITLAKGKFYNNLAIAMGKKFDLATASFTGDYDAYIYQTDAASSSTSNTITIAAGKKVILAGVNISVTDTNGANAIICNGSANIVLSGTNTLLNTSSSSSTNGKATIKAGGTGTTLTISGCGALDATHKSPTNKTIGSVIGSDRDSTCGDIIIKSGTIVAKVEEGSDQNGLACAIGSGGSWAGNSQCGDITIEGGNITATTSYHGAAIGAGSSNSGSSSCGNITISGGTVTASANRRGAAIGSGYGTSCGDIHISGGTVNTTISYGYGAAIGCGWSGTCGTITIDGTASVEANATSGTCGAGIGGSTGSTWGDITISGAANVTARGGGQAAGIGSGSPYNGSKPQGTYGNISISTSGSVTATGGADAAGIGSGNGYACGTISITGGTITTTGGNKAAGIGTGGNGTCGDITVTSGVTTVDATRDTSDNFTYDIGSGNGGTVGTVTIDASVTTSDGKHYTDGSSSVGYNKEP